MPYASAIRSVDTWRSLGRRVRRTGLAADIATIRTCPLFQTSGGDVQLMSMYGIVVNAAGLVGAQTIQVNHTPTAPAVVAANAMCAASGNLNGAAFNTIYTWDGLLAGVLGAAPTVGTAIGAFFAGYPIVIPGVIGIACTTNTGTGLIDWIVHYIPLAPGATLNAV